MSVQGTQTAQGIEYFKNGSFPETWIKVYAKDVSSTTWPISIRYYNRQLECNKWRKIICSTAMRSILFVNFLYDMGCFVPDVL